MKKKIRVGWCFTKGDVKGRVTVEILPGSGSCDMVLFEGGSIVEFFNQIIHLLQFLGWKITTPLVKNDDSSKGSIELLFDR